MKLSIPKQALVDLTPESGSYQFGFNGFGYNYDRERMQVVYFTNFYKIALK